MLLQEISAAPGAQGIGALPPEVLAHVFAIGSQENDEDDGYVENISDDDDTDSSLVQQAHFATLCSHVCQYWRSVALSTPQLWSNLEFEGAQTFEKYMEWIARSKGAPLTIQIDLTADATPEFQADRFDTEDDEDLKRQIVVHHQTHKSDTILEMILPHVHQWKTFELVVDYYELIWVFQTALTRLESAPILEHLGFFCHEDWIDEDQFSPQSLRNPISLFQGGTPKIRSVCLWGVHFQWETATYLAGLACLQLAWHTKDVRLSCEQFAQTLTLSPKLEVLILEGSAPLPGTWPEERIPLHFLRALSIAYIDVSDAISVVQHIDFPALKNLTLDLEAESVKEFIHAVCARNKPRFGSVESLKLTSFQCLQADGILFLSNMPNVVSLTLNFNYLPGHFRKSLASNSPSLCPKLHTLKLSGLDAKDLKSLIKGRQKSSTRIQSLYLDQDDAYSEDTIRWLKREVETVLFYEASDDSDGELGEEDEVDSGEEESEDE
ncbi:hypothetical protein K439DRAFT_1665645 [Ramaria rubella]|nr:hypothetical protein K439DRAFT_1665645 [Ramaria rubella]